MFTRWRASRQQHVIDYCNTLSYEAQASAVDKLQRRRLASGVVQGGIIVRGGGEFPAPKQREKSLPTPDVQWLT